jgi:hypothetical protein
LTFKKPEIFEPYQEILETIDRIMYKKIIYKSAYLKTCLLSLNAREVDPHANLFCELSGILTYEYLKTLSKGQNHGEISIMPARGLPPTICLSHSDSTESCWLNRREYSSIFLEAEHLKIQKKLKFFHEKVFRGYSFDSGIQTILHNFHKDFFLKNEIIYRQNSKPEALYVVIKGWVKLYCLVDRGKHDFQDENELKKAADGNLTKIDMCSLGPGEIFGEFELFEGEDNPESVRRKGFAKAIECVTLWKISYKNYLGVAQVHESFNWNIRERFKQRFAVRKRIVGLGEKLRAKNKIFDDNLRAMQSMMDEKMGQKPPGWAEENFGPGSEKFVASGDVSLLGREKKVKHV